MLSICWNKLYPIKDLLCSLCLFSATCKSYSLVFFPLPFLKILLGMVANCYCFPLFIGERSMIKNVIRRLHKPRIVDLGFE